MVGMQRNKIHFSSSIKCNSDFLRLIWVNNTKMKKIPFSFVRKVRLFSRKFSPITLLKIAIYYFLICYRKVFISRHFSFHVAELIANNRRCTIECICKPRIVSQYIKSSVISTAGKLHSSAFWQHFTNFVNSNNVLRILFAIFQYCCCIHKLFFAKLSVVECFICIFAAANISYEWIFVAEPFISLFAATNWNQWFVTEIFKYGEHNAKYRVQYEHKKAVRFANIWR